MWTKPMFRFALNSLALAAIIILIMTTAGGIRW